ncbi:MAG: TetR/AcrR family transcriptional regulator [Chromatiales bacterium]|nr:TetR/AcrR family transcriptional regulator [Chromatiales bacterium]
MSEVAKVAGVADGTVFYNFKTKEELYLAVLDEFRGQITSALDEFLAANEFASGLQRVEGLIGFYVNLAEKMADRFLLLHRYDPYRIARTNPAFRRHLGGHLRLHRRCLRKRPSALGQQDGSIDTTSRRASMP